jgi:hypothetical protein
VPIDQQGVVDVPRNYSQIVHIYLRDIINDVNATASGKVSRFDNPLIFLRLDLLKMLKVVTKFGELVRDDISVGEEIKGCFSEFLLHFSDVECKLIFPGDFSAAGKVIDFLELI